MVMFDDERYKRQYNIAREKCLLRRINNSCILNSIAPREERKCLPDEYDRCPLFVFLRSMNG